MIWGRRHGDNCEDSRVFWTTEVLKQDEERDQNIYFSKNR